MKHLLTGVAIAALFAVAAPTVSAQTSPGGRDTTVNQNRPMTPGSSATDDMKRPGNRQGAPGTTTRDTTPSTGQGAMSSSGATSGQGSMSSSGTMSGQSSMGATTGSADRPMKTDKSMMKTDKSMKSSDKSMKNRSASGGSMSSDRAMSGSGRETSAKASDPESGSTAELNRQELQRIR